MYLDMMFVIIWAHLFCGLTVHARYFKSRRVIVYAEGCLGLLQTLMGSTTTSAWEPFSILRAAGSGMGMDFQYIGVCSGLLH